MVNLVLDNFYVTQTCLLICFCKFVKKAIFSILKELIGSLWFQLSIYTWIWFQEMMEINSHMHQSFFGPKDWVWMILWSTEIYSSAPAWGLRAQIHYCIQYPQDSIVLSGDADEDNDLTAAISLSLEQEGLSFQRKVTIEIILNQYIIHGTIRSIKYH